MDIDPPEVLKNPLTVTTKLLMGPGPSSCSPRVLQAIMDDIKEGIQYAFQTKNELTLAISGSGHTGMEAVFSATVNIVSSKPGVSLKLSEIANAIERVKPKLLFIVQGDSSTGVLQPVDDLGPICPSLCAVPFDMDRWGVDAAYTCSQKILGAPPGLAPISFSPKARDVILSRKTPVPVYYWDMTLLGRQWNCFDGNRIYHHTVSANLLYGLREGLAIIADEGLEHVIQRHGTCAKRLYHGLEKMGFKLYVEQDDDRLCSVTTVSIPEWIHWDDVVLYLRRQNVTISGGLGPTAGKAFRIGLMGYNATLQNVIYLLNVLQEAIDYVKLLKISKL
ncbi:unnamed protein product [Callosobruchus maculatus]|uniref:Alanine--glyoxylate aminotransferase n=1 Tax=Callosobruchus maculatus TaxID=64391 RepID=A0A653CMN9_CALMS|nr:unnamed protein product [Callosobruchus maculatus]